MAVPVRYASLLVAMDDLWFYQIVLVDEPVYPICSKSAVQSSILTGVSDHSEEDNVSTSTDSFTSSNTSQDDDRNEFEDEKALERTQSERPATLRTMSNKSESKSQFRSKHRQRNSQSYPSDKHRNLHTFLNGKALRDLEQLELKGFADLGFEFKQDQHSPRTLTMIPGLKRLGEQTKTDINDQNQTAITPSKGKENEVGEEKNVVKKPYLSDAWSVKKPNSPLLRLRMARVSTAQDMKKCLKLWARTVATSIGSVQ
ncbi:hypothetical protein vseg_013636 [Gypsophila vaccaria]